MGTKSDRNLPFASKELYVPAETAPDPRKEDTAEIGANAEHPSAFASCPPICPKPAVDAAQENLPPVAEHEICDDIPGLKWTARAPRKKEGRDAEEGVVVGSLESMEKGSGARKNAGKAQLDLVPVEFWYARWSWLTGDDELLSMLSTLQEFQEGDTRAIHHYLATECPDEWMDEAVKVLEFGAKKYAAWNWACGMDWSVCIGCALRHTKAIVDGEEIDPDSGLKHYGHIVCNLIFLAYFVDHYPEGDDRPPRYES